MVNCQMDSETTRPPTLLDLACEQAEYERLLAEKLYRMRRRDFAKFCESVIKDDQTGDPIVLHDIHHVAIKFVIACRKAGKNAAIQLPFGTGKSTIFSVAYPLFELGHNINATIRLVSAGQDIIKTRVRQAKSLLENDTDGGVGPVRQVFPSLKPDKEEGWATEKIYVRRGVTSFPSFSAFPVFASAEGGRCSMLIFDDVVSRHNSILNDRNQDVIDACEGSWMKRLYPGGFCLFLNTPWTTKDFMAHIRKSRIGRWAMLRMPLRRDINGYDVEVLGLDGFDYPRTLPLWDARFPKQELEKIYQESPREFRRGFFLDPYAEEERKLPHFQQALDTCRGLTVEEILHRHPNLQKFMGVDLSSERRKGTVEVIIASDGKIRVPIAVKRSAVNPRAAAESIVKTYVRYNPTIVYVENNGLQEAYQDLIRLLPNSPAIPLKGFMTGRNKSNPEIGIEGMDAEMMQGLWIIPYGEFENHEVGCTCDWCVWRDEMLNYPNSDDFDTVMATWFAWHAARGKKTKKFMAYDCSKL